MVQAIGGPATAGASAFLPKTSAEVLQSQLDRYQVQLDDWCNCPSGKTPEGKAKIRDLTDKVAALKAQLQQVDEASPSSSAAQFSASAVAADAGGAGNRTAGTAARPPSVYSPLGSRIDVFA